MLPDIINYIPDPNNGRPIANGQVYFFIDGYTPPTNINDVNPAYVAEVTAGGAVLPQPIYTTQGGVLRTGSLANMPQVNVSALVKRVAVYDKCGSLIYSTDYESFSAPVTFIDSVANIYGLDLTYINSLVVGSYHPSSTAETGGTFIKSTGRHNGGTFIDPERAFPTDWSNQDQLTAWFADSGEDVIGLERQYSGDVDVRWFGAIGDGVANDAKPLNAATALVFQTLETLDLCDGTYLIDSQYTLAPYLKGAGAVITGANAYAQTRKFNTCYGVIFQELILNGVWHYDFKNCKSSRLTFRGFSPDWGSFYNEFKNCDFGEIIINVQEFAVNQNTFLTCHAKSTGGIGLLITDGDNTTAPYREAHNNSFIGCDFSYGTGCVNTTNLQQTNTLIGCYVEGGAQVTGPFDIQAMNMDGLSPPNVGLTNHVMGMTPHIERTGADFLSMSSNNLILGGEWEALDSSGVPVSFSGAGVVNTNINGAKWWGTNNQYGTTTSADFQAINVAIPALNTDKLVVCGFWSGDLPASVTYNGISLAPSYQQVATGIYLFRVAVYASTTAMPLQFFITTTGGVSRTGHLGAIYATPFKAAAIPFAKPTSSAISRIVRDNGNIRVSGGASIGYTTTSPATSTIDYSAAGLTSAPEPRGLVMQSTIPAHAANAGHVIVTSITSTEMVISLYFTTEFSGAVFWEVEGV